MNLRGQLGDTIENNDVVAVTAMEAFINATLAQSGEQIEPDEAEELIGAAQEIIKVLGGDFF